jgi:putative nucleotidyltransferase with HDIG domain
VPVYTTAVAAVGFEIILLAFMLPVADWPGLVLFAVIAAVVELLSVELFASGRGSRVSISAVIAIASIPAFGPLAGAIVHAASGIMTAVTTSVFKRQEMANERVSWLRRSAFNIGMLATSAASAGCVYALAGGTAPHEAAPLAYLAPLLLASAADVLLNIAILVGVIALQTGQPPLKIWKQNFEWSVPISMIANVIGGGGLAMAYGFLGVLGLAVFMLPVISTGYSFRLYVNHTRVYVNQLEEMNQALDETNTSLLEMLGAIIDADDVYTYGHSNQISIYAGAIAEKMKLGAAERTIVAKAALIHDIGKIGVADSIIGKPGRLTAGEYDLVKRHTLIGAEIVGRMKGLHDLVPIVRHHHEHWDGAGYPDGLAGTAIPIGARIVAVADAVEAMCSDRPYRPSRSLPEVLEEIRRCSGTQFDPDVVGALYAVAQEKGPDFFTNSAAAVDHDLMSDATAGFDTKSRHLKKSMLIGRGWEPGRSKPSISAVGAPQA